MMTIISSMSAIETIHPVILPVSPADQQLRGRPKVAAMQRDARKALSLSARYSGYTLGVLEKDENGAPLPFNGIHWSLSHKSAFVAAVVSRKAVGIDIEHIKTISDGVQQRVADAAEYRLAPTGGLKLFFRFWTAKEAVLKAVGIGLAGLDGCRVHRVVDERHMVLSYEDGLWTVTHLWIGPDHLAAVTSDGVDIQWHVGPAATTKEC